MLTGERVYWIPRNKESGRRGVIVDVPKVRRLARRYVGLRDVGVEVFYDSKNGRGEWGEDGWFGVTNKQGRQERGEEGWKGGATDSVLLGFENEKVRDSFV